MTGPEDNQDQEIAARHGEAGEDPSLEPSARQRELVPSVGYKRTLEYHSGPLPSPEVLGRYNDAVPDAAERILRMAENEAAHRREIERFSMKSNLRLEARGQIFAFAIAMLSVGGGLAVIAQERPLLGAAGALTAVGTLVGLFLWTKARPDGPSPPRGG